MALLYIVRHGIAIDREDPASPAEGLRYLTEKGIEKTTRAAKGFARLGYDAPKLVLSSPWVRAQQTAEIFIRQCDWHDHAEQQIVLAQSLLPEADISDFFDDMRQARHPTCVALFGHASHTDRLIAGLLDSFEFATPLKKAGVAIIEVGRWEAGGGVLLAMLPPRVLIRLADAGKGK